MAPSDTLTPVQLKRRISMPRFHQNICIKDRAEPCCTESILFGDRHTFVALLYTSTRRFVVVLMHIMQKVLKLQNRNKLRSKIVTKMQFGLGYSLLFTVLIHSTFEWEILLSTFHTSLKRSEYRLDDRGFDPGRDKGSFSPTCMSRPALRPTQPPVQWVPGGSFPELLARPVTKPLPPQDNTTQRWGQTSKSWAGFEPTNPLSRLSIPTP
jgi:hypothetical protein